MWYNWQQGRMQEWLNWHAWKVCRLFTGSPGFESPSFRQELFKY